MIDLDTQGHFELGLDIYPQRHAPTVSRFLAERCPLRNAVQESGTKDGFLWWMTGIDGSGF